MALAFALASEADIGSYPLVCPRWATCRLPIPCGVESIAVPSREGSYSEFDGLRLPANRVIVLVQTAYATGGPSVLGNPFMMKHTLPHVSILSGDWVRDKKSWTAREQPSQP